MANESKKLCTCGICFKLSRKATALRMCNHIFCWTCINGKITKHNWDCCPVCYVEFGPDPLLQLRYDDPIFESLRAEDMEMIFENSDDDEPDDKDDESFVADEERDESEDFSDDEDETDESDEDDYLFESSEEEDEMSEPENSDDEKTESDISDDECIPVAMDTESESDSD